MTKRVLLIEVLFFILLFFGLLVFYSVIHPYIPWVSDDWGTLSGFARNTALPFGINNPSSYTPSRISPDIFGVIIGYIGAYIIKPITGNYVFSLTFSSAFFLSGVITFLFIMLYRLFYCISKRRIYAFASIIIVILFAFMFMKSKPSNNWYLFEAVCICDIFYYMATPLLAFCAIAYDLRRTLIGKHCYLFNVRSLAIAIPIVYFLAMSVIPSNIPLFIYVTLKLMYNANNICKLKPTIIKIKTNWVYMWYYCAFFIHAFFEFFSGRARSYLDKGALISLAEIRSVIKEWITIIKQFNIFFIGTSIVLLVLSVAMFLINRTKRKDREVRTLEKLLVYSALFCFSNVFITMGYLIVINDTFRSMLLLVAPFLSVFVLLSLCGIYIFKICPVTFALVPFVISLLLVPMLSTSLPLTDSAFFWKTTSSQKYALVNGWITQIKEAVDGNASEVVLELPPDSFWNNQWFPDTLFFHGIINRTIVVRWE